MQAIEIDRSPGLPSLMVTTRRRLMPHGTSFWFLQAVTQALHSMHRSASQRECVRAFVVAAEAVLIWKSVALGSCIPIAASKPYVVRVFTLSRIRIRSAA